MEPVFQKLQRHLLESKKIYDRSVPLRTSIYRFAALSTLVLALFCASLFFLGEGRLSAQVFVWVLAVIIAFTVFVFSNLAFLRNADGTMAERLNAANKLTAVRLFMAPAAFILLIGGRPIVGSALYLVAVITDVIDGHVARRMGQGTNLGIMLDPIGDIILTLALFLFLWLERAVPYWLFALLLVRYAQFFIGLAVLAVLGAVPRLKATMAGKIVGVVQALGIIVLLVDAACRVPWPPARLRMYVFVLLGTAFSFVIVSQTIIGWRALRMIKG